jgi:hypothetical protein
VAAIVARAVRNRVGEDPPLPRSVLDAPLPVTRDRAPSSAKRPVAVCGVFVLFPVVFTLVSLVVVMQLFVLRRITRPLSGLV